MSILRFDNVSYQYPGEDFDIIDGLSFSVEPGSFHCIVGVSGCGKSTIFRMINGLLPPKAGTISVNGKPITAREHYCGYMPQKDMLFPWRTIVCIALLFMPTPAPSNSRNSVPASAARSHCSGVSTLSVCAQCAPASKVST